MIKKIIFTALTLIAISSTAFAKETDTPEKISYSEREMVFQAIYKIDVLADFYESDLRKFTLEESPEKLREYLLSLAAMKVRLKLMMRMPFGLTKDLKELQEMKITLNQKSLNELIKMVSLGKF